MNIENESISNTIYEVKHIQFFEAEAERIQRRIDDLEAYAESIQTPHGANFDRVGTSGHTTDIKSKVHQIYSRQAELEEDKKLFLIRSTHAKADYQKIISVCRDEEERNFIKEYMQGASVNYLMNKYYISNVTDKLRRILKRINKASLY